MNHGSVRGLTRGSLLAGLGLVVAGAAGCGVGYPVGSFYTGTQTPQGMMQLVASGSPKLDTKTGEACATGILGIAGWGDASLAAAKKAAGVNNVSSVEFGGTNILGIYTRGCTIVVGAL